MDLARYIARAQRHKVSNIVFINVGLAILYYYAITTVKKENVFLFLLDKFSYEYFIRVILNFPILT